MKKNETGRTITYLVVAGVSIGLALLLAPPGEITPEELQKNKVGKEFYKDFNPNDATSISVFSFDEAKATSHVFEVKFQNGKWTIPSHHNYPADGQDRLAKTATSAKGIKRDQLASSSKQYHEQLGVVDPMSKDATQLKGRGQQVRIKKGEDVLVDLIIGKQVKDRPGFYYVRKPDEDATFVAKLDLSLSTKFSEWVETDLLKLNRDDLKEMVIDNYSIDKAQGVLVKGEISRLERDKVADPWKLEGVDESKEEVDVAKVNGMLGALDDLKLVGVRPKPKGFNPDLTLDPEFVKKQSDLNALALDLQARGFALVMDKQKHFRLYSDQGELRAATNKGVVYTLRFGDLFLGDETEIEIGGGEKKDDAEKKDGDEKDEQKDGDEQGDKAKAKDAGKQSSRYLFVTVSFDEKFLGPRPEKPARPEGLAAANGDAPQIKPRKDAGEEKSDENNKSEGEKKSPDDAKKGDEGKSDENCPQQGAGDDEPAKREEAKPGEADAKKEGKEADAAKDEKKSEEKKSEAGDDEDKPEAEKTDEKKEEKKKSPEQLKKEYDDQVKKYETDLKAFEDKVEAGKKQVDELNARFSGWYYVISADYFNKLHLSRKELVKEKAKPAGDKTTEPATPQDEADKDKPDDAGKDDDKPAAKKDAGEPKEE